MKDITELLQNSNSKLIRAVLDSGGSVLGIKVENFAGKLIEDKEFSEVLAKKLSDELGIKGYISSDELPCYGITHAEKDEIEEMFECGENDIVIFVADEKEKATKAIEIIEKEISQKKG